MAVAFNKSAEILKDPRFTKPWKRQNSSSKVGITSTVQY